ARVLGLRLDAAFAEATALATLLAQGTVALGPGLRARTDLARRAFADLAVGVGAPAPAVLVVGALVTGLAGIEPTVAARGTGGLGFVRRAPGPKSAGGSRWASSARTAPSAARRGRRARASAARGAGRLERVIEAASRRIAQICAARFTATGDESRVRHAIARGALRTRRAPLSLDSGAATALDLGIAGHAARAVARA